MVELLRDIVRRTTIWSFLAFIAVLIIAVGAFTGRDAAIGSGLAILVFLGIGWFITYSYD